MKRSLAVKAALLCASSLLCVATCAAAGRAESWASLSKTLNDRCGKFDNEVKDLTLTMEMTNPSSEGTLKTESVLYQKGKRFRAEISMDGMKGIDVPAEVMEMKTVVIGDGTDVWMINPAIGKTEIPRSAGDLYRGNWECSNYLPASAEVVGNETVGERDCYVVAVKDTGSAYTKLWIDERTYSLVKFEGKPEEGETIVAVFSDFRKVADDMEIPYKTEMFSGESLFSTITINSVHVNTGMSDDLFDPDKVENSVPNVEQLLDGTEHQGKTRKVE
jgi:outer membrane lipoprotein-sorting protein